MNLPDKFAPENFNHYQLTYFVKGLIDSCIEYLNTTKYEDDEYKKDCYSKLFVLQKYYYLFAIYLQNQSSKVIESFFRVTHAPLDSFTVQSIVEFLTIDFWIFVEKNRD